MTKPCSRLTLPLRSASVAAINPSRSVSRVESKLSSTEARKMLERAIPPTTSPTTVQIAAAAIRRAERELNLRAIFGVRIFKAIAKATHRLNEIGVQLSPQASDEHLDCIGVAIEILIIKMLHELCARNHPALVVSQILQKTVFQRRQLYTIS